MTRDASHRRRPARRSAITRLLLALCLCGCAAQAPGPPHGLSARTFALPAAPAELPAASFDTVEAEVDGLQATIGGYPPRFTSEAHRDAIYARWSNTLLAARALDVRDGQLPRKLYLLGELYRQGHNLDVAGAASEAVRTVETCIETYPGFLPCHRSASYLYLSTSGVPSRLERAERSLTALRDAAAPDLDDDAEAGFIWLAIHRQDRATASRLIDRYLAAFPHSSRAEGFRAIQRAEVVTVKEWAGP